MRTDKLSYGELTELVLRTFDGKISEEQFRLLQDQLIESPEARTLYLKIVTIHTGLSDYGTGAVLFKKTDAIAGNGEDQAETASFDSRLWKQLAKDELAAPTLELPKPAEDHNRVLQVEQARSGPSRFSFISLAVSAAALIMIVLFVRFAPLQSGVEVATLSESINAKWADTEKMSIGQRVVAGSRNLLLREGCAEILFDNNARITIEAPAEFQILTRDQIKLNYGRVYATITEQAYGFTISTDNAKVIDLGTEFGIQRDAFGNMELHVIKGRTNFISSGPDHKTNSAVSEGAARKLSGSTGQVEAIALRNDLFIRKIDSKTNLIWKGQTTLHLVDIVGGGNGFETANIERYIDPVSGKLQNGSQYGFHAASNDYRPSALHPFIDGTFIPNGQTPQVISSRGHLFTECPVTSGLYSQNIRAFTNLSTLVLENVGDHKAKSPFLYMHSNMGITFDLQAIRESLPGAAITRFQSQCGLRRYADYPTAGNADFWVIVDGKVRFKQEQVRAGGLYPIDIELSENDRFLTLVETDGGDPNGRIIDGMTITPNESDWGVFVNPILVLR